MNNQRDFADTEPSAPMPLDPLGSDMAFRRKVPSTKAVSQWTARDEKRLAELLARKNRAVEKVIDAIERAISAIGGDEAFGDANHRHAMAVQMNKNPERLIAALQASAKVGKST